MSLARDVRRQLKRSITQNPVAWDERKRRYVWIGGPNRAVRNVLLAHEKAKADGEIPSDTPLYFTMHKPEPESLSSLAQRHGSLSSDSSSRSSTDS